MCCDSSVGVAEHILVTGASGFVGRALLQRFRADAAGTAHVRAAVRAQPGAGMPPLRNVDDVVVVGDLAGDTRWTAAVDGVSCVVHCAGLAHLPRSERTRARARYQIVNVDATLALARAAVAAGVQRIVFVSSIKVNGEETTPGRPFTPADAPSVDARRDPYAASKADAEAGLGSIGRETGLEVVIVRAPLVYGPGARANFGALVKAVAYGIPLPLAGVQNCRSLIGLDNLADFLAVCAGHPAAARQVLLVSDGEDLSTTELVFRIGRALDRPARLVKVPEGVLRFCAGLLGQREAARRLLGSLQVDSASSHRLLDWRPPVSVDDGLRRAVASLAAGRAR